jgi:hypothetical protein
MGVTEIVVLLGVLSALVGGAAGFITAMSAARRTTADVRKSAAETEHVTMDTASDYVTMIRAVYEVRVKLLEEQVFKLERVINDITREAHAQRLEIVSLQGAVALWRGRVEELLQLLREHGISFPGWAVKSADNV